MSDDEINICLKVELHTIHSNGYLKAIDEKIDDQIQELKGEQHD